MVSIYNGKGSCNLSLDTKNFNRIKIPIIPKKEQDDLIKENC